ncbi:hypothetical protein D3C86_1982280 [compost metagenome]
MQKRMFRTSQMSQQQSTACAGETTPLQRRPPFTNADVIRKESDYLDGTIRMVTAGGMHHRLPIEPASPFPMRHLSSAPLE